MKGLPRWIFALFGLLVLIAVLEAVGRKDSTYMPSIESSAPSGTRVFADLLREEGFQVSSYNGRYIGRHRPDLLICLAPRTSGLFETEVADPTSDYKGPSLLSRFRQSAFEDSAEKAHDYKLYALENDKGGPLVSFAQDDANMGDPNDAVWATDQGAAVYLTDNQLEVSNPLGVTNQFIDRGDNAAFWVGMVKNMTKKGGTILFWEGPMGAGNPPSFLEELSLPLARVWGQIMLLGLVVAVSIGARFGQPIPVWDRQGGTRDLLVAFGDILRRGKQIGLVQEIIQRNALLRLRRKYGLSSAHSEEDLMKSCTPEEAEALRNLKFVTNTPQIAMPRILEALRVTQDDRRR